MNSQSFQTYHLIDEDTWEILLTDSFHPDRLDEEIRIVRRISSHLTYIHVDDYDDNYYSSDD